MDMDKILLMEASHVTIAHVTIAHVITAGMSRIEALEEKVHGRSRCEIIRAWLAPR